jgi:hypothetical protein
MGILYLLNNTTWIKDIAAAMDAGIVPTITKLFPIRAVTCY